jgi:hypothetical protein
LKEKRRLRKNTRREQKKSDLRKLRIKKELWQKSREKESRF